MVPAKANENTATHHMVKGYETMHSTAVGKQILKPNPEWSRAPLMPVGGGDGGIVASGPAEDTGKSLIIIANEVETDEVKKPKDDKELGPDPKDDEEPAPLLEE